MKSFYVYGSEGKSEKPFVDALMQKFFGGKDVQNFLAIAFVGLNPYRMNKNELDMILSLSWSYNSSEHFLIKKEHSITGYNKELRKDEVLSENTKVFLKSVFLTIEIKAHDASAISIVGDDLYVRYKSKSKLDLVTAKLINQGKTASSFLNEQFGIHDRVVAMIYLPNVATNDLSIQNRKLSDSIIFKDTTYQQFLQKIINIKGTTKIGQHALLGKNENSFVQNIEFKNRIEAYYKQLQPTTLEQDKLEMVSKKFIDESSKKWTKDLGQKLIAFFGRAGTGKTVKLLRTATDLAIENMEHVLFLTFNRALARDLQRLMQLQKISSGTSITVRTIDQFLYNIGVELGIAESIEETNPSANRFEQIRKLVLEKLNSESIDINKIDYLREFTYIAIDEAQDWFQEERDIVLKLMKPSNIIIAAGTDQCLRAPTLANWKGDVERMKYGINIVKDTIALRQTSNLSIFCNKLSENIQLSWTVEPNPDVSGGTIYLFNSFTDDVLNIFLEEIKNNDLRYDYIDYLLMMSASHYNKVKIDNIFKRMEENNILLWDAINDYDRGTVPEKNKVRCVSLESCRGLEGWATILFDLDSWYDFALAKEKERNPGFQFDNIKSLPTWFLIPFTRARKRILIEIPHKPELREIFLRIQKECSDFIEILN